MPPPADKRRIGGTPQPETAAWLRKRQARWLEDDLELARAFDIIHASEHYLTEDCASLGEYGTRLGYGAAEAFRWADIGLVLRLEARAEERIRLGRLTLGKAMILKPIYADPACLEDGRDWLDLAADCSPRALRRQVRRRVEEVRQREAVVRRDILAPVRAWEKFDRAKDVASSKAGTPLSDGQTLERVSDVYLDRHDPLRRAQRKARRAHTPQSDHRRSEGDGPVDSGHDVLPPPASTGSAAKRTRKLDADIAAEVWLRSGGTCELPGCGRVRGLQGAHVQGFAHGGPNHPRNIVLLCRKHHTMFDRGRLLLLGWREDGRPILERIQPEDGSGPRPPPS